MLKHCTHISSGAARRTVKLRDAHPILAQKKPEKLCIAPDFVDIFAEKYKTPTRGVMQAIEFNGGVDGTRTRGLCRDRAAF